MQDSKLLEILKTFSSKEWKDFEKFVNSPYFSSGRDVSGIYALLKKYYPQFTSENLNKEKVFASLFPKEKFNEKKLKNITSDLTKIAEQFLVFERLASNEITFDETLARVYKGKKNDKLFLRTLNLLEKKLSVQKFQSDRCFSEEERYERLMEEYFIGINKFDKSVPKRVKYTEYFTLTFLVSFLRKQRDKIVIEKYYNLEMKSALIDSVYESIDFDKMLKLLKEKKSEWLWFVEIYYYVMKSIQNVKNESMFNKLQELFYKNIDKFSRKEQYFMFNDFIAWIHTKDDELGTSSPEQEFEVFKKMLEQKAYSPAEEEYMSVLLYRNLINIALNLQEYDWFENFVTEFTPMLKPEFRENMKNLAMAKLYFDKGSFEESLESLSKIPYDVFIYKLDIKNLMLRIYYELDLTEAGFSMVNAYRNFLSSSDEVSETFRKHQSNFLFYYNKLLKAKADNNFEDVDFILSEINKKESIAERTWLIEKAEKLIKK